MQHRRTKIIATLGPATDDEKIMEQLLDAGVDVVRLNFSHGTFEQHKWRIEKIREISKRKNWAVGILGDLQGAKIRIGKFQQEMITLQPGQTFALDANVALDKGNEHEVGITFKELPGDVKPGDVLLLDDGRVTLEVVSNNKHRITTKVLVGGELSSSKGINRKGGGLSAPALTDKDKQDIKHAASLDVDYLAVSFPKSAADLTQARQLLQAAGGTAGIIAKIERAEALTAIDEILKVSDAVMIARGDLGVEIGDAEVPGVQKLLIRKAHENNRLVITATQMMESMVYSPIPTRAEVSDVANAVLDGTDAMMLSEETARGEYPVETIQAMHRICIAAEQQELKTMSDHRIYEHFDRVDEAIAMATMYIANHLNVAAIAALTESGSTALWMSRISSAIPIYAMTAHEKTRRKVTLYKGVYPARLTSVGKTHAQVNKSAVDVLLRHKEVNENDLVIITKGDLMGVHGGTNAIKIVCVGHMLEPEGNE